MSLKVGRHSARNLSVGKPRHMDNLSRALGGMLRLKTLRIPNAEHRGETTQAGLAGLITWAIGSIDCSGVAREAKKGNT